MNTYRADLDYKSKYRTNSRHNLAGENIY